MSIFINRISKIEKQLLLGRLLTRSGDQAWDFVVPFALLHVFPGKLQLAAVYYFIIKLGTFLLTPLTGKWIDLNQRSKVVKFGIWTQFFAVLGGILVFYALDSTVHSSQGINNELVVIFLFGFLACLGIFASVGTAITDIAVGNDLAPALIPTEKLTQFNSWLRRIDLGSEVGAPIVAGVLFATEIPGIHLWGLLVVAFWNLISFVPEYLLLSDVIKKANLPMKVAVTTKSFRAMVTVNFKELANNPIFWLILSNALLWLSVLSPHGVLLAGYLKDKELLPEGEIGLFRGLGAIFGLISTFSFPYFAKRLGLIPSSKLHLFFQGLVLAIGITALTLDFRFSIYVFLGCVLLSRIGLYGFSNGEFELRQRLIPENQRGELNSFSYLTTTFATLILFAIGSLLPRTEDFKFLVYVSLVAVLVANLIFFLWSKRRKSNEA